MASQLKRLKLDSKITFTESYNISTFQHWASDGLSREWLCWAAGRPGGTSFSQGWRGHHLGPCPWMLQGGLLNQVPLPEWSGMSKTLVFFFLIWIFFLKLTCWYSGQCGSVEVLPHAPEGWGFNPHSGHIPRVWVRSPVQACMEDNQSMFLSPFLPVS